MFILPLAYTSRRNFFSSPIVENSVETVEIRYLILLKTLWKQWKTIGFSAKNALF